MSFVNFFLAYVTPFVMLFLMAITILYRHKHDYWQRRNIPHLKAKFPFFSFATTKKYFSLRGKAHKVDRIYKKMKKQGWKHGGFYFFTIPFYMVVNLDYIKDIVSKNFAYFTDRSYYYNEKSDPLSANLFFLGGAKWKYVRTKMSPAFTSNRMKVIFPLMIDSVCNLLRKVEMEYEASRTININDTISSFVIEMIGSCVFGVDCNLLENKGVALRHYALKSIQISRIHYIIQIAATIFPQTARCLGIKMTPKDVENFFLKMVEETVKFREENNYTRADIMQLIIEMEKTRKETSLTTEEAISEITAQCLLFFVAGFETSANTMTFALYELSKHEDVQDKVRNEIITALAKHNHQINFEMISELTYLHQVLEETLRMYPPLLCITRKCVRDYKIPNEDIVIENGTLITIPVQAIHYDPEYYPDPYKFDPERFTPENKIGRHRYAYIPFGEGPRICIGKRFGLMQVKIGLISLLQKYKFNFNKKTKEPIQLKVDSLVAGPETQIWLDILKV